MAGGQGEIGGDFGGENPHRLLDFTLCEILDIDKDWLHSANISNPRGQIDVLIAFSPAPEIEREFERKLGVHRR